MKKNTKYSEDVDSPVLVDMGAVEFSELIEQKIENKPKGRTSKAYKNEVNEMIDEYNRKFGKIYSRVT